MNEQPSSAPVIAEFDDAIASVGDVPLAARSGMLFLKLFIPPRYYGAWLVFGPDGTPLGVVDEIAGDVLRSATGVPAKALVAPGGQLAPRRVDAVLALLERRLLEPGTAAPELHWIAPDQQQGTRHRGRSADLFISWFYQYFGSVFYEGSPLIDSNEQFLPILQKYFPSRANTVCLDAGSGSGFYSAALARAGHAVFACDISETRLAASAAQAPGQITPVWCNLEDIPLPDRSVDFAMCNFVLEHVSDPYKVVEEMVRTLRPGGRILLAVPSFNIRDTLAAHLFGEQPSLNFEHLRSYGLVPQTHPWCEPITNTLRHLEGCGIRVVTIEGVDILKGLWEPFASGFRVMAEQLGAAFTTTWPLNCLGQQTIIEGERIA
ncbi:class I SAM-dependent methyltransferase [Sorangium sp. So ce1014]|uniref:class I SAM-dependent methyltransferase n=1 Tax=Sorangium sp. So ce1014 TaxID=3133326 RepID=UPI003F5F9DBF